MNCPDHETLSAYFDGEAPEAGSHVAACGECRAFLDDLTAIRAAVVAARPVLEPGFRSREPRVGERSRRAPIFAFVLLLLVLLVIPAILRLRPANRDEGVFSKYDAGGRAVIYLRGRE